MKTSVNDCLFVPVNALLRDMTCPYSRLITAFSRYVKAFCTDITI
ncbi:hypothetical protein [Marseilla massiliensis]|nr:hypothetical protein [Marseilla massiliensis]